jgi:hypothetical protein
MSSYSRDHNAFEESSLRLFQERKTTQTDFESLPVTYDRASFEASIEMLILVCIGEDHPRKDLVKQLAADLARLPKMTLAELVELLAQARGCTLDPETLWKITDTIAEEIANPSVRES